MRRIGDLPAGSKFKIACLICGRALEVLQTKNPYVYEGVCLCGEIWQVPNYPEVQHRALVEVKLVRPEED